MQARLPLDSCTALSSPAMGPDLVLWLPVWLPPATSMETVLGLNETDDFSGGEARP